MLTAHEEHPSNTAGWKYGIPLRSLPPPEVKERHLVGATVTGPEHLFGSSYALKENDNSTQFILEIKKKKAQQTCDFLP